MTVLDAVAVILGLAAIGYLVWALVTAEHRS